MLKMVRTPISRRTGATFFIALWCAGANMKPMPVASMHSATCAGCRSRLTPNASITSAAPDFDDTPRFPCLATRAPRSGDEDRGGGDVEGVGAITAGADHIEEVRAAARTTTLVDISRITVAAAVISLMVSFLTRRPVRMAAVITGDTSPAMIWRISDSISS
jgi:hypothetical protein